MSNRIPFLMHGRRFHNLFRKNIESDDGRGEDGLEERPVFEHYACGMFLSGCLSYLENTYGQSPWKNNVNIEVNFDTFLFNLPEKQKRNFEKQRISENGIEALVCLRNAYIHNSCDLKRNRDQDSLQKVLAVTIPGIRIDNGIFTLISNNNEDFMEYVRMSLVAVAIYYGDG